MTPEVEVATNLARRLVWLSITVGALLVAAFARGAS